MSKKRLGVLLAVFISVSMCFASGCNNAAEGDNSESISISEEETLEVVSNASISEFESVEKEEPEIIEKGDKEEFVPIVEPYEEVPFSDDVDTSKYYADAYRRFIESGFYDFTNFYYWQFGSVETEWWPYHKANKEGRYLAITDATGDNKPECMVVSADSSDAAYATLRIYTSIENDMDVLFEEIVDGRAEGGSDYVLFKNGLGELYLFTVDYGVSTFTLYKKIGVDENGSLRVEKIVKNVSTYDYESDTNKEEYFVDNITVTKEEYETEVANIVRGTIHALLYDGIKEEGKLEWLNEAEDNSLSMGEALYKLMISNEKKDNEFSIASGQLSMSFSSGVGGWSTEMSLNADGSFSADFHDSDMGDCGDGYPDGTIYIGSAEGKFTNIKKIDDYTYSCELVEFNNSPIVEPYIDDNVLWVPSDTYGVSTGHYMFCLPGKPVSEVPKEVLDWAYAFVNNIDTFDKMPLFVLYCEETCEPFYY